MAPETAPAQGPAGKQEGLGPSEVERAHERIKHASQVWKFGFYGFFKNLQFFEPFLLLIFLAWGVNLFQIGLLVAVQQVVMYLFEVPSGIWADRHGKRTELLVCFVFYIVSFVFYFLGPALGVLFVGAIFYGLGEAFRSGTHKAMILTWLDKEGLSAYKTFVYGRTRSFSLVGSALSAVMAIAFILVLPASRWIFLVSTIPFVLDFLLIASYPAYMNEVGPAAPDAPAGANTWQQVKEAFKGVGTAFKDKRIRRVIVSSASYDGIFKTLKDYIQPIVILFVTWLIVDAGDGSEAGNGEVIEQVVLGVVYALFYLASAYASRNAHKVLRVCEQPRRVMNGLFDLFAGLLLAVGLLVSWPSVGAVVAVVGLYLGIYALMNVRRPVVVDVLGSLMAEDERATILSVETLLKSVVIFTCAPLFGFIAEYWSIQVLFLVLPVAMILLNHLALARN